mmetsp:Transcript_87185/g.244649  ORF Transcript_87185/g.244649 Transcript_87185/m.244649 type:complete len:400 (+) Transcript_87185:51-1250(+)
MASGPTMSSPEAAALWKRLVLCGRLPESAPPCAIPIWLGDYAGGARTCEDEPLRRALEAFCVALPRAERSSAAFFVRKQPRTSFSAPPGSGVVVERGTYTADDGTEIGYVFLACPPERAIGAPALLLRWGGNAELAAMAASSPRMMDLVASGLVQAIFADYRGFGWSAGTPSLSTFRGDADALYRALPELLRSRGQAWPQPGRVIVMGRSIGALCALHVAALHADEIHGLILDSPCTCHWPMERIHGDLWDSLRERLPPLRPAARSLCHCECCGAGRAAQKAREAVWLDPADLIQCVDMPLLVVNGTADRVCPPAQTEDFFKMAAAKKKQLVWIEGKDHNEVATSPTYWRAFTQFLEAAVREAAPVPVPDLDSRVPWRVPYVFWIGALAAVVLLCLRAR